MRKKRERCILVRLTDEEWEMVHEKCEELGVSMATYFRILIRRARIEILRR